MPRIRCDPVDGQRKDFIRLGVLGDWSHPYLTMDFKTEANIIRALGKIIGNGHLHKGAKPVHWCVDCRSALAEAEVEYYDKTSPSIDVAFRAVDQDALKAKFGVSNVNGNLAGDLDHYAVDFACQPRNLHCTGFRLFAGADRRSGCDSGERSG